MDLFQISKMTNPFSALTDPLMSCPGPPASITIKVEFSNDIPNRQKLTSRQSGEWQFVAYEITVLWLPLTFIWTRPEKWNKTWWKSGIFPQTRNALLHVWNDSCFNVRETSLTNVLFLIWNTNNGSDSTGC